MVKDHLLKYNHGFIYSFRGICLRLQMNTLFFGDSDQVSREEENNIPSFVFPTPFSQLWGFPLLSMEG